MRVSTLLSCPRAHNKTEPGYYADGEYGARIENVVIVCEVQTPNNFGNKGFLGFERVTMVFSFHLASLDVLISLREGPLRTKPHRRVSSLCGRTRVGGCVS